MKWQLIQQWVVVSILLASCICWAATPLTIPNPSYETDILASGTFINVYPNNEPVANWITISGSGLMRVYNHASYKCDGDNTFYWNNALAG
ncbi:MAG: hypothetical protein JW709_06470, partial [Sedimentisphaerales bacterium]|nr:hypothetical protein [Sedimentisphaerales bacterium]